MTELQLYPPVMEPRTLTRQVWGVDTARSIPGVGRALDLISGLALQMPINRFRGPAEQGDRLPRTRFLEQPDLDKDRPTFIEAHIVDYLLHGNACHLITARPASSPWVADGGAVRWYPAHAWHVQRNERTGAREYWLHGRPVSADDVVHVQNGVDPLNDCRGVGVVERYVKGLDRVALQDERQRTDTAGGYVPSVAVIAPDGDDSTDDELDQQAANFEAKFDARNGGRRPAIFPYGTTVQPLAWSPHDSEMSAARQASLIDVANMFNLDATYLGAQAGSHNYKSPAPMFLVLLRTSVNRVVAPLEAAWSRAWVPYGQSIALDREPVLADDFGTTITTLTAATGGPVMSLNEGRSRLALGPIPGGDVLRSAAPPTPPAPADPDPAADPTEEI